jgi:hypothetical protein
MKLLAGVPCFLPCALYLQPVSSLRGWMGDLCSGNGESSFMNDPQSMSFVIEEAQSGVSMMWYFPQQVNYLGPYMLTRLLEGSLAASAPSRVINVSSVTHRYGLIDNAASFLSRSATAVGGQYPVCHTPCHPQGCSKHIFSDKYSNMIPAMASSLTARP